MTLTFEHDLLFIGSRWTSVPHM